MKARALEPVLSPDEPVEIIHLEFDVDVLVVTVSIDNERIDVEFDAPVGFRALDEGDLLEFWPECSTFNGWLFQVQGGGWFAQESMRGGFLSSGNRDVKEYFIIGLNYCVSVLGWHDPDVNASTR
ncbi:hypothetical protein EB809_19295 [Marinobacter sp. R17]|nr:hypothetical protein EB809_19295 [Marinobacter sp. R17]